MIYFSVPRYKIALFILILLMTLPVAGHASCQTTLQWDANSPVPEGYLVFGRTEGQSYNYDEPWWSGDSSFTQCTIDQLDETTTYYFVVRAYVGDEMSGDSNEVAFNYSDPDVSSSLTTNTSATTSAGSAGGGGGGCFIQSLMGFVFN